MIMGAPTKYTPEMCEKVMEAGRTGATVFAMSEACGVDETTLYEWNHVHPDFSQSLTRAKQLSKEFWYNFGQEKIESQHFKEKTFEMLLRLKCSIPEKRRIKLKALNKSQTHSEQMSTIIEMLRNGELAPDEAKTLSDVIKARANVDEVTELRKLIEQYEKEAGKR